MSVKKNQSVLILLLLAASTLALYPGITLEKAQQSFGIISIEANGQAFPIGKGKPTSTGTSANLTLFGSMRTEGNGELKLSGLTGNLTIGSAIYALSNGHGEANKKGKVEINAEARDGDRRLEIVLHGQLEADRVVFDRAESKLSSLYFLSLTGQAVMSIGTATTSTTQSGNETVLVTVTESKTVTMTVTQTVTETGTNSTVTVTQTITTTIANSTTTVTMTVANTTLTGTTT